MQDSSFLFHKRQCKKLIYCTFNIRVQKFQNFELITKDSQATMVLLLPAAVVVLSLAVKQALSAHLCRSAKPIQCLQEQA